MEPNSPCPCGRMAPGPRGGRPVPFAQCCGRYLADFAGTPAPDAESLMRSRYCAFVLHDGDYLMGTWHASTRPSEVGFEPGIKWLGLDVRRHVPVDASHAEVEFVARCRQAGRATRIHERSRFVREEGGRWYYVDGDPLG